MNDQQKQQFNRDLKREPIMNEQQNQHSKKEREFKMKHLFFILVGLSVSIGLIELSFGAEWQTITWSIVDIFLAILLGCLFIYLLAKNQVCWTLLPEGKIIAIQHGESVKKYIAAIKGKVITHDKGEIFNDPDPGQPLQKRIEELVTEEQRRTLSEEEEKELEEKNAERAKVCRLISTGKITGRRTFLERYLGAYWMGLWPIAKVYTSVDFRANYPMESKGEVETLDKVPVKISVLTTIEVVNTDKMLFKTSDWFSQVTGGVQGVIRDYGGENPYIEIIKSSGEGASKFVRMVRQLNEETEDGNPGIVELYGVKIPDIDLLSLDVNEEYRDATLKEYISKQEAKAEENVGNAVAKTTGKYVKAISKYPQGAEIMKWRALEKQKTAKIIVFGNSDSVKPMLPLEADEGEESTPEDKESTSKQSS